MPLLDFLLREVPSQRAPSVLAPKNVQCLVEWGQWFLMFEVWICSSWGAVGGLFFISSQMRYSSPRFGAVFVNFRCFLSPVDVDEYQSSIYWYHILSRRKLSVCWLKPPQLPRTLQTWCSRFWTCPTLSCACKERPSPFAWLAKAAFCILFLRPKDSWR